MISPSLLLISHHHSYSFLITTPSHSSPPLLLIPHHHSYSFLTTTPTPFSPSLLFLFHHHSYSFLTTTPTPFSPPPLLLLSHHHHSYSFLTITPTPFSPPLLLISHHHSYSFLTITPTPFSPPPLLLHSHHHHSYSFLTITPISFSPPLLLISHHHSFTHPSCRFTECEDICPWKLFILSWTSEPPHTHFIWAGTSFNWNYSLTHSLNPSLTHLLTIKILMIWSDAFFLSCMTQHHTWCCPSRYCSIRYAVIRYCRHGQSEYNAIGRIGGDSGLSVHGINYAKKLAEFVDSHVSQSAKERERECIHSCMHAFV
jgi:hypothetical protein